MRRAGYATVDALVARLADPGADAVLRRAGPAEMRARLAGPPPEQPGDYGEVLGAAPRGRAALREPDRSPRVLRVRAEFHHLAGGAGRADRGRGQPVLRGVDGGGRRRRRSSSRSSTGSATGWGCPGARRGVLVTGGSAANLTALLVARDAAGGPSDDEIVYVSDQAHSSLARTARAMGLRPHQVRVLPTDDRWRLQPGSVAAAVRADRDGGPRPVRLVRQRRVHQHRGRRSAGGPGRRVRRRRTVAARGRGVRRLRGAGARRDGSCWPGSSARTR